MSVIKNIPQFLSFYSHAYTTEYRCVFWTLLYIYVGAFAKISKGN